MWVRNQTCLAGSSASGSLTWLGTPKVSARLWFHLKAGLRSSRNAGQRARVFCQLSVRRDSLSSWLCEPLQKGILLHEAIERERDYVSKVGVIIFQNLITEATSFHSYCIFLIPSNSLGPACTQRKEYQEGLSWGPPQRLLLTPI